MSTPTPEQQAEELLRLKHPMGAICGACGFRYFEHNGHIIACPVCAFAAKDAQLACDACDGSGRAISGPCGCNGRGVWGMLESVRLVLAAKDAEIERLKSALEGSRMWREDSNQKRLKLIEEVAQLRSQLAVAEGMRNKAEFWIQHRTSDYGRCTCSQEQHHWTDEMWIAQAERKGAETK